MERSPEQKLFLTVIVQATHDAAYTGHNKYLIMHKRDAINWLTGNSKDFQISLQTCKNRSILCYT